MNARRLLVTGVLALGGVVALAGIDLWRIANDLSSGRQVVADLDLESLQGSDVAALGRDANRRIQAADDLAHHSRWIGALSHLPYLGGQVAGLRDITQSVATVGDTAEAVAVRTQASLELAGTGPGRIALLDTLQGGVEELRAVLDETDIANAESVGFPLSAVANDLREEIADKQDELAVGARRLAAAHDLLAGPGLYLVLAANNAEMTGGTGMPLSAGGLRIADGEFHLTRFVATGDHFVGFNRVDLPDDLGNLYGPMGIGGDFRGTTATPNFPVAGRILSDMAAIGFVPVKGVFVIDAITLARLVRITGPVTVDGRSYDSRQLLEAVLHGNYQDLGTDDTRYERRELQARMASAAFDALQTRDIDVTALIAGLAAMAQGRHLLAWSPDPDLQELWEATGAAGVIPPDGLIISVENYDGNKRDYFIRPVIDVSTVALENGDVRVTMDVQVYNPPLPDEPPYVSGIERDTHYVFLDAHLPEVATDIEMETGEEVVQGRDGVSLVARSIYPIREDETVHSWVRFTLPADATDVTIIPSARVRPTRYLINGELFRDFVPTEIALAPPVDRTPSGLDRTLVLFAGLLLLTGSGLEARRAWSNRRGRRPAAVLAPPRTTIALSAATVIVAVAAAFLL